VVSENSPSNSARVRLRARSVRLTVSTCGVCANEALSLAVRSIQLPLARASEWARPARGHHKTAASPLSRFRGTTATRGCRRWHAPAGARFRFRVVLDILCEEDKPLLARVLEGLRLLEDDALGGGGSRGSGRVSFGGVSLLWRGKDYYAKGAAESSLVSGADLAALQQLASAEDFGESLARSATIAFGPGWLLRSGVEVLGAPGLVAVTATPVTGATDGLSEWLSSRWYLNPCPFVREGVVLEVKTSANAGRPGAGIPRLSNRSTPVRTPRAGGARSDGPAPRSGPIR